MLAKLFAQTRNVEQKGFPIETSVESIAWYLLSINPFLDYAFGFRRGENAGRPPDSAGPRAEFPLPFNGIPGGSR